MNRRVRTITTTRPTRPVRALTDDYFAGFDLSLTGSGIVIMKANGVVVERHVIKVKTTGAERLNDIQLKIKSIIKPYDIKLVCIEGYAMGAKTGHTFGIGELGGVVRLFLYLQGIKYITPPPTQVKKFVTGKGGGAGGSKDQVCFHVYKRWGFEPTDNNDADAYALARMAIAISGNDNNLTTIQQNIISDILNPPLKKPRNKKEE